MLWAFRGAYSIFSQESGRYPEPADGSPADAEPLGDLPLADTLLKEPSHLSRVTSDRLRSAVWAAFFAGSGDPGLHAIAEDVPLEFSEDREHAGQCSATRCREVERLAERDEADLKCGQFLKRRDQIDQRTAPAVQSPDKD